MCDCDHRHFNFKFVFRQPEPEDKTEKIENTFVCTFRPVVGDQMSLILLLHIKRLFMGFYICEKDNYRCWTAASISCAICNYSWMGSLWGK